MLGQRRFRDAALEADTPSNISSSSHLYKRWFASQYTGFPDANAWNDALGAHHALTRYDGRGCGLSDRDVGSFALDELVADLESVVDAAGLERFALLGISQGGAVSIVYAARHPERVSHLVLCGAFARGGLHRDLGPAQRDARVAMVRLVELGWGQDNPAFLQMFTSQFFPDATPAQAHAFNEIQRRATSPWTAARLMTRDAADPGPL